jgi:hypothetical protein
MNLFNFFHKILQNKDLTKLTSLNGTSRRQIQKSKTWNVVCYFRCHATILNVRFFLRNFKSVFCLYFKVFLYMIDGFCWSLKNKTNSSAKSYCWFNISNAFTSSCIQKKLISFKWSTLGN